MDTLANNRTARTVCGLLVALLATCFAAASHAIACGHTPEPIAVLVATLVVLPLAIFTVGRRQQLLALCAAVIAIQALFHWLFMWLQLPSSFSLSGQQTSQHAAHSSSLEFSAAHSATDSELLHPTMLAAHLFAAVVAIMLLWGADKSYNFLNAFTVWATQKISLLDGRFAFAHTGFKLPKFVYTLPVCSLAHLQLWHLRGPPQALGSYN